MRALTDENGTLVGTLTSDAFGANASQSGVQPQPFGYAGQQVDSTGLVYLRARYYDPSVCRFMSQDTYPGSAGSPLSLNRYTYVLNSPTLTADPSGLCSNQVCGAVNLCNNPVGHLVCAVVNTEPGPGGTLQVTPGLYKGRGDTGGGDDSARFITNAEGMTLDTSRIIIAPGKLGYLLYNKSKAGVFSESLGFDEQSLQVALRQHLIEHFDTASTPEPMKFGGVKIAVKGTMTGPSGKSRQITTVWGIDADGTVRLITARPS